MLDRIFCPRCGTETSEGYKFCKSCGTNLQLVSDAIGGTQDPLNLKQYGIDVEAIKRNLADFGNKIKKEITTASKTHSGADIRREARRSATNPVAAEEHKPPKPKEYLTYSWQHNLRDGLLALFGGLAFGAVLYYFGHAAVASDTIGSIESRWNIHGLSQLATMMWILAAVPVVKGVAQIAYAACFAESIKTLAQRFAPPQPIIQNFSSLPAHETQGLPQPPASVTEQTTDILGRSVPKEEEENPRIGLEGVNA